MGLVAMETVCRTFNSLPLKVNTPCSRYSRQNAWHIPHNDLHCLANNLKYLSAEGDIVVLRLFSAAFNTPGPEPGQYEDTGSAIMSLRFQKSDQWDSVQYALSEYYQTRTGENAALMTEAACIAWNSIVGLSRERHVLATIQFRGMTCELIEDYSHISGRSYEYNGNRILTHFEKLLREWTAANDIAKLNLSLNRFAACNHTSMMWTVFMEAGAEYPSTFGVLLECVLDATDILTALDYSYGGTALFGALHKIGDAARRERLEKLILDLPNKFQSREGERSATRHPRGSNMLKTGCLVRWRYLTLSWKKFGRCGESVKMQTRWKRIASIKGRRSFHTHILMKRWLNRGALISRSQKMRRCFICVRR